MGLDGCWVTHHCSCWRNCCGRQVLKLAQAADEIADTAEGFDTTVGSILELQGALEKSGGDAESLSKQLTKLASTAEAAKDGGDKAREAFAKLGITGKEVETLKPDELYRRVAMELANVENTTQRAALAQEILGKGAKAINWSKVSDEIAASIGKYDDAAQAINDWGDAWDNLKAAAKSTLVFMLQLLQPIAVLINQVLEFKNRFKELKQEGGTITTIDEFGIQTTQEHER